MGCSDPRLFAIYRVRNCEETQNGLNWLRTELPDYWNRRERITLLPDYVAFLARVSSMAHRRKDGQGEMIMGKLGCGGACHLEAPGRRFSEMLRRGAAQDDIVVKVRRQA